MRRFLTVILLFGCWSMCFAAHDWHAHTLQQKDGLSSNNIECIFKDSYGFMWFGTSNGHTRNQMAYHGVKAIAGFELAKPCVWQGKLLSWEYVDLVDSIQIGDITINCKRVDHNKEEWGKNFVTTYEINCGPASGNTVIYHIGDAHNYRQLEVAQKPDIFIFHMGVGLNIQKALDKIQPDYAIFSHAWELSHKVEKFRWTIDDVLKKVNRVTGHDRSHLLYPCWGDKIVYKK